MSLLSNFISYIVEIINTMDTLKIVYDTNINLLSFIIYIAILVILIKIVKELI